MSERLWAPWRLPYIKNAQHPTAAPAPVAERPLLAGGDTNCFFCRDVVDHEQDRQNLVVHRGSGLIVILNRFPYNNGHVLVAPQRHLADLEQLDRPLRAACMDMLARLVGALQRLVNAEGFNIGLNLGRVAGAGVPGHLHWHVVPRWNGDSNFMPVLSDTRVVSQALDAMWELLAPELTGAAPDNSTCGDSTSDDAAASSPA
ncbi:MAG TPA: HIT domain-containing protein [Pirellulales bacterium]|nr:HIT domain-containing protein [Pirellulales bacterium]